MLFVAIPLLAFRTASATATGNGTCANGDGIPSRGGEVCCPKRWAPSPPQIGSTAKATLTIINTLCAQVREMRCEQCVQHVAGWTQCVLQIWYTVRARVQCGEHVPPPCIMTEYATAVLGMKTPSTLCGFPAKCLFTLQVVDQRGQISGVLDEFCWKLCKSDLVGSGSETGRLRVASLMTDLGLSVGGVRVFTVRALLADALPWPLQRISRQ